MFAKYFFTASLLCIAAAAAATPPLPGCAVSTAVQLRDPARQGAIDTDAALYNPAGTAFLNRNGLYLMPSMSGAVGVQKAWIDDDDLYDLRNKSFTLSPGLQAVWKRGNMALSFSFANEGGMGRRKLSGSPWVSTHKYAAEYEAINQQLQELNNEVNEIIPYFHVLDRNVVALRIWESSEASYNWCARVGAAFKIGDHVSVYAGLKANRFYSYQRSNQIACVNMHRPEDEGGDTRVQWDGYITSILWNLSSYNPEDFEDHENYELFLPLSEEQRLYFINRYLDIETPMPDELEVTRVESSFWSFAPVFGLDLKLPGFNFGAKYEFAGLKKDELQRTPSLLSAGVSLDASPNLKLAAGADVWNSKIPGKSWQAMASATVSLDRDWEMSGGLTVAHRYFMAPEAKLMAFPEARNVPSMSLGCGYNFSDRLRIDIGMRVDLTTCDFRLDQVRYRLHDAVAFGFGLTIRP